MKVLIMQTADAVNYRRMLDITSQTAIEYCARHDCHYESFLGIKRGYHPWHAAYNRIPMLASLVRDAYSGWVVYMDADAYICDLDFNLRFYLADKGDISFIAAPGGATPPAWYLINDGIFAINLAHADGRQIIAGWHAAFMRIADDALRLAKDWDMVTNDQILLQEFLRENPALEKTCLTGNSVCAVINHKQAQFIRQVLRVHAAGGMEQRLELLRETVAAVMGENFRPHGGIAGSLPSTLATTTAFHTEFLTALYQCLLLREPDPGGLANGVRKLSASGRSLATELRACLSSPEFRGKAINFLGTYLSDAELRLLARQMAELNAVEGTH